MIKFSHIDYRSSKGWSELIPPMSCLGSCWVHRYFSNSDFSFSYSNLQVSQIDYIEFLEWWFLILVQWFPNLIHRLLKLDRWFKTHTTFVMLTCHSRCDKTKNCSLGLHGLWAGYAPACHFNFQFKRQLLFKVFNAMWVTKQMLNNIVFAVCWLIGMRKRSTTTMY